MQRARSVNVCRAGASRRRAAALFGVRFVLHARDLRQQIIPTALKQRQLGNSSIVNDAADNGIFTLQLRLIIRSYVNNRACFTDG